MSGEPLRQNKIKISIYFAILAAAAGDRTRKGTLTVPFHSILPSDPYAMAGSLAAKTKGTQYLWYCVPFAILWRRDGGVSSSGYPGGVRSKALREAVQSTSFGT